MYKEAKERVERASYAQRPCREWFGRRCEWYLGGSAGTLAMWQPPHCHLPRVNIIVYLRLSQLANSSPVFRYWHSTTRGKTIGPKLSTSNFERAAFKHKHLTWYGNSSSGVNERWKVHYSES